MVCVNHKNDIVFYIQEVYMATVVVAMEESSTQSLLMILDTGFSNRFESAQHGLWSTWGYSWGSISSPFQMAQHWSPVEGPSWHPGEHLPSISGWPRLSMWDHEGLVEDGLHSSILGVIDWCSLFCGNDFTGKGIGPTILPWIQDPRRYSHCKRRIFLLMVNSCYYRARKVFIGS